jgi:hypothetical protein
MSAAIAPSSTRDKTRAGVVTAPFDEASRTASATALCGAWGAQAAMTTFTAGIEAVCIYFLNREIVIKNQFNFFSWRVSSG